MISPTLNVPQARFLSMPHKFKAYIAGFGSGKTWVGCGGICKGIWEHPGINQGYFAPTYPQIRDIFYPTVEEVAADWGLNVKINEGNKEVHFYYGRQYPNQSGNRSTWYCEGCIAQCCVPVTPGDSNIINDNARRLHHYFSLFPALIPCTSVLVVTFRRSIYVGTGPFSVLREST